MTSSLLKLPVLLWPLCLSTALHAQYCHWRPEGPRGPGLYDSGGEPCDETGNPVGMARYASRWGAIATSNTSLNMGVSFGERSKLAAQRSAMDRCGTPDCRVDFTYRDQCVAVAWGVTYSSMSSAMTVDEAIATSMKRCQKKTSDCEIVYTECSPAEPVP
ncbi:DUF4189 domain-containing protein [Dyella sp. 2RAB6]|uniref:DUF4189 domain-containing protein n=1 Tax=Dyella sp. 2RAB6 TaxID=3232992 RepID=UPI003F93C770